ncbi:NAD(P)/FAD-dependent oxidoreductase [Methylovulum sp.]|uniref:NAD(P)/FAD-dependent oxidoreductase n=1 Tax=Methylovulum sp. TaxID=1916980 RepID=UPI00262F4C14|nr:NAD(P)/FAD-dependent oxidoreductase [Methylovulum sp.]MDD5123515.1 NAD(P)/FAD-dependent oxidoreductase [Methylovulum sp.]
MIGIIGGGVAGMACALWLKQLGCTPIILEQNTKPGGQLLQLNRINRWVLGSPGQTSVQLAETYAEHIRQVAVDIIFQARLLAAATTATGFAVEVEQAGTRLYFSMRALVIATGTRVLGPEIFADLPGFSSCYQAGGISFFPTAHVGQLPELAGKSVAVIGGGDNAYFTAKDAALAGAQVHLLIRSRPKARPVVHREVLGLVAQGRIIEHVGAQASAFRQHQGGIEILLQDNGKVYADRVFARLGFAANTEFLDSFAVFNGMAKEAGYIKTDASKRTSIPWVYAIGDVANAKHQSVVNAIAEGAIAAQDLSERV